MDDAETTTAFAGLDGRTDTDLPTWFEQLHDGPETVPFTRAIRQLPRATETQVAFKNPYTDEWIDTDRFNALVEPERLMTDDAEESALFHVPSDSYSIINPTDVYSPLAEVLRETEVSDTPLAEVTFGEVRQYRDGGEVHMDIMFDGLSVTLPGKRDPITMGVTTGYDFFGNNAVYVEGFARDTACANSIRALTDRQSIRHVGDVEDFRAWWEDILGQLELVADDLYGFIQDAADVTIDIAAMPFDHSEFYTLLGFPEYLAEHAAEDARMNADDPFEPDMWTLHSGATYALTHYFRGKEGSALERYTRLANDILFNPEATIDRVEQAYEQQVEKESDDDGQRSLESANGLAQIERVSEAVQERAEQFEEREEQLRARFEAEAD
jgi:hypothetical protein